MPYVNPENRRRFESENRRRLQNDPGEAGERYRQRQRDKYRRYKAESDPEWWRARNVMYARRRRENETPDQREKRLARTREMANARNAIKRSLETPDERADRLARSKRERDSRREEMKFLYLMRGLRDFGITLDQYHAMLERQDFACAICESAFNLSLDPKSRHHVPHIDHCHTIGKVRGLLCTRCNTGIGHLRETPRIFQRAAAYVKRHRRLF